MEKEQYQIINIKRRNILARIFLMSYWKVIVKYRENLIKMNIHEGGWYPNESWRVLENIEDQLNKLKKENVIKSMKRLEGEKIDLLPDIL